MSNFFVKKNSGFYFCKAEQFHLETCLGQSDVVFSSAGVDMGIPAYPIIINKCIQYTWSKFENKLLI